MSDLSQLKELAQTSLTDVQISRLREILDARADRISGGMTSLVLRGAAKTAIAMAAPQQLMFGSILVVGLVRFARELKSEDAESQRRALEALLQSVTPETLAFIEAMLGDIASDVEKVIG